MIAEEDIPLARSDRRYDVDELHVALRQDGLASLVVEAADPTREDRRPRVRAMTRGSYMMLPSAAAGRAAFLAGRYGPVAHLVPADTTVVCTLGNHADLLAALRESSSRTVREIHYLHVDRASFESAVREVMARAGTQFDPELARLAEKTFLEDTIELLDPLP